MVRLITIIFSCWLLVVIKMEGQELTFISPLVEQGIRQHLNISENEQISFTQLDTITTLDLSRRGITDIRDLVLMPKLRTLNLSDNQVKDLHPLAVLDSLEWVDLSCNSLKGINDLFDSSSPNMTIIVSYNHISDFSLFTFLTTCDFTLVGTGLQQSENPPRFDVNQLYANFNEKEQPVISYSGYTNLATGTNLKYGSSSASARMDGGFYQVPISEEITGTTKVTISNGEISEDTYMVPAADHQVKGGQTVTLSTGLPDDYYFSYAHANKGKVETAGTTMKYTAPADAVPDIISFCYYQGYSLKGYSRFYVNWNKKGDVNGDGKLSKADAEAIAQHIIGQTPAVFNIKMADMNGDDKVDATDIVLLVNMISK